MPLKMLGTNFQFSDSSTSPLFWKLFFKVTW